jgi:hypothetical protein
MLDEAEAIMRREVFDIGAGARLQVVYADNGVASSEQMFAQMRSQKTGSACDENSFHL